MTDTADSIRRAIAFPIDHITARYAQDQDLPIEVAREHEIECKRFLALCAVGPGKKYGMRGPIDKYWHTFIMFTREYSEFCEQVAHRFLHHVPRSTKTPSPEGSSSDRYRVMLHDYQEVFGEEPPRHLWPRARSADDAQTLAAECSFNLCSCDSCVGIPDPPDSCTEPSCDNDDDNAFPRL